MILISVGEGGPGVAGWRARDNRRRKCLSEGKVWFGGGIEEGRKIGGSD